jgi:hypothetical protein
VPDSDVGRFVFDDLADANEASSSSIAGIKQLGKTWRSRKGAAGHHVVASLSITLHKHVRHFYP